MSPTGTVGANRPALMRLVAFPRDDPGAHCKRRVIALAVGGRWLAWWLLLWAILGSGMAAERVGGWRLLWSDEYDQPDGAAPDESKWTYDLGGSGWGNNELQTHTARPQNSRIEGGCLVIEARAERHQGADGIIRDYTSARLKTEGRAAWIYGRFEARIRMSQGRGLWPALWMLGANHLSAPWPACGEIDVMENVGHEPSTVYGGIHGPGYSGGENVGATLTLPRGERFADGFHLFAVEWGAEEIRWSVDNRVHFQVTPADLPLGSVWVFDQPFFLILSLAVGGDWPGPPDASTVFPQRMMVDYVRIYGPVSSPAPKLRTREMGGGIEVSWPLLFPQARLQWQRADTPVEDWLDLEVEGNRRGVEFIRMVEPGFYRLEWDP